MKLNRHIALLFLICFSAFLGHSLVPHHHHGEALLNPIATDCNVPHGDHHCCDLPIEGNDPHQGDSNTHCHAFNDVVFAKYQAKAFIPLSGFARIMLASAKDLVPGPQVQQVFYKYKSLKFPLRILELVGSRDLRGPPHMA